MRKVRFKMAEKTTQAPLKAESKSVTTSTSVQTGKKANEPTYTVNEFAAAPDVLDTKSADIVTAALTLAGKEAYTVSEAKNIVKKFKEKEVK